MYNLTRDIKKKIKEELIDHFDFEFKFPKIVVYHDPQDFFNDYTGTKKKRSLKELIDLDSEVSYYYNDDNNSIILKGFIRNGFKSLKRINKVSIFGGNLIHECIHSIQVQSGGYGNSNMFVEGACEFSRYVLLGDLDLADSRAQYTVYFPYMQRLWNLLDATENNSIKKYELIRDWNISKNKTKLTNQYVDNFLKKYPKVANNRRSFMNMLDDLDSELNEYQEKILIKQDADQFINEIYSLHDEFGGTLINLLK